MSVPDDLRNVLEQCLAEDATPDNLEIYLPTVRQIITNLLQGLRGKQSVYRRIMSDHKSDQSRRQRTSSRTSRSSKRDGDGVRSHRSQLSRTISEDEKSAPTESESLSRRSGQSSRRRKDHSSQIAVAATEDEPFVPPANDGPERSTTPSQSMSRRQPTSPPLHSLPSSRNRSASGADDTYPVRTSSRVVTPAPPSDPEREAPPIPPPPQVPASVKRYSLVDKPVSAPTVVVDESSDNVSQRISSPSPPDTPHLDALAAPAMANSLAALKKSDALERRASKRFSTYNISKMTGSSSTTRDRSLRSNHPNRRSMAAGSTLTPGDLKVLTEEDEETSSPTVSTHEDSTTTQRSGSRTPPATVEPETSLGPPSPTPTPSPARARTDQKTQETLAALEGAGQSSASVLSRRSFPVFLQLGREVKKATIEPGLSFSSLRVLFVDKFSYNPGLENFPAIYIRDPSSGVQYELENVDEVKEKCLLSLNIEREFE